MRASTRWYVARTVSRGAIWPTITIGIPRETTFTSRPAGSPGRGIGTGSWSPTAMRTSEGASGSWCAGWTVARVANGEPTTALCCRRLSDITNAASASFQKMYWPPIPPGHANWRSLRNRAMISIGRMASTSSTITTAGSETGAKIRCRTVKAECT